jgi:hypothetical protein
MSDEKPIVVGEPSKVKQVSSGSLAFRITTDADREAAVRYKLKGCKEIVEMLDRKKAQLHATMAAYRAEGQEEKAASFSTLFYTTSLRRDLMKEQQSLLECALADLEKEDMESFRRIADVVAGDDCTVH